MAVPEAAMRTTIASYRDYAEAQAAVDALADRRFLVERLAIVGQGLRTIEQVTGRKGLGRAALDGAVSGALTGGVSRLRPGTVQPGGAAGVGARPRAVGAAHRRRPRAAA